jgi:hypothetical protein
MIKTRQKNDRSEKYLKVVRWAQNRYTKAGRLVLDTGGIPSTYSKIEKIAFERYMRQPRDSEGCLVF